MKSVKISVEQHTEAFRQAENCQRDTERWSKIVVELDMLVLPICCNLSIFHGHPVRSQKNILAQGGPESCLELWHPKQYFYRIL